MKRTRSAKADVSPVELAGGHPRFAVTGRALVGIPSRSGAAGLAVLVIGTALVSGCGSSTGSSVTTVPSAIADTGRNVSAVLSDGPDPGADPVGYAEAQILPLRQVRTSEPKLQTAIDGLAAAYQQVSDTNGASFANQAATRAVRQLNAMCPVTAS
jgi:hypothetical protein